MEEKKNVETFSVQPVGPFVMVVNEVPPLKSGSGKIVLHAESMDEILRKGTVVAVGEEVKRVKVGDRVLHLFNAALGIEMYSRDILHVTGPMKVLMKEADILAVISPANKADTDPDAVNTVCRALKAEDFAKARNEKWDTAERRDSGQGIVVPNLRVAR